MLKHVMRWLTGGAQAPVGPHTPAGASPVRSALDAPLLHGIQRGTLATRYRGRALLKSPFDLALYMQLIQLLTPGSIIEIGAHEGGSALWFADTMRNAGLAPRVVSVDRAVPDLADARVQCIAGDALALDVALPAGLLAGLPRPWLVVEDSAHHYDSCLAVLRFFDAHLRAGDYIVVEDGVVALLDEPAYRQYDNGPVRAVAQFLAERAGAYEIDRGLCDFYGENVTYNPDSWLRRVAD